MPRLAYSIRCAIAAVEGRPKPAFTREDALEAEERDWQLRRLRMTKEQREEWLAHEGYDAAAHEQYLAEQDARAKNPMFQK